MTLASEIKIHTVAHGRTNAAAHTRVRVRTLRIRQLRVVLYGGRYRRRASLQRRVSLVGL